MLLLTNIYRCNISSIITHQKARFCIDAATASSSSAFNMPLLPQSKIHDTFERLRSNPKYVLLLDGGTGEELFRRQVPDDRKIWSATALVHEKYHTILEDVHTDFLESGSDAITTNSYGVCPGVGFESNDISKYNDIAGKIARRATQKSSGAKYVLGSLGPLLESYRPDMLMSHEDGVKSYMRACNSLAPHIDAFIAETMSCVEESIQVLDAVARSNDDIDKSTGKQQQQRRQCSLLISYTLDPNGNFRDGEEVLNGMRRLLERAEKKRENVQCKIFSVLNSNCVY
jgi:S-methylmethionine-dependent homocysteine/selenocysteine methylase